jgi:hypothetical protein
LFSEVLFMRTILLFLLLLASSGAVAEYTLTLNFPDKSVEICTSPGYQVGYLEMTVNVTECNVDTIFIGNMGG